MYINICVCVQVNRIAVHFTKAAMVDMIHKTNDQTRKMMLSLWLSLSFYIFMHTFIYSSLSIYACIHINIYVLMNIDGTHHGALYNSSHSHGLRTLSRSEPQNQGPNAQNDALSLSLSLALFLFLYIHIYACMIVYAYIHMGETHRVMLHKSLSLSLYIYA